MIAELTELAPITEDVDRLIRLVTRDFRDARAARLKSAMQYSLYQAGAKRFRPTLALLTAQALAPQSGPSASAGASTGTSTSAIVGSSADDSSGATEEFSARPQPNESKRPLASGLVDQLAPFCVALECVHTYSLIHDDLPAMDDDDLRRGQPTNHRQFDEATAILAGDALLTDAFSILAEGYLSRPAVAIELVRILSEAAGSQGMIAGQMLDLASEEFLPTDTELSIALTGHVEQRRDSLHHGGVKHNVSASEARSPDGTPHQAKLTLEQIRTIHELKTGALIRAAVHGGAVCVGASTERVSQASRFGATLGLAFQVADDLLDANDINLEPVNVTACLGVERTRSWLGELTQEALDLVSDWGESAEPLRKLVRYNALRST